MFLTMEEYTGAISLVLGLDRIVLERNMWYTIGNCDWV